MAFFVDKYRLQVILILTHMISVLLCQCGHNNYHLNMDSKGLRNL